MTVITRRYRFETREQLDEILKGLLDIHTGKVFSIKIVPKAIEAELSDDIEIVHSDDNVFDQVRATDLEIFSYDASFSIDVLFAMMKQLRSDELYPAYIVLNSASFIKELPHWHCALVDGITESRFLGLVVIEDNRLDEDSFVLAGCTGTEARVYTIKKSLKGARNE